MAETEEGGRKTLTILYAGEKFMRQELEHFMIGDSYGGNQDWFPTFMIRIGGCGAETACDSSLYFAIHRGLSEIAPANAAEITKEDYIRLAYVMRPYLSPRMSGIDRLDIYIDGYTKYLKDRGETRLAMKPFDGTEPFEKAKAAVIRQIDAGYPIPTLVLNHRNPGMKEYVWHWFLINGYDESEDSFRVRAVTYGEYEWLNLRDLWETGHKRRGGFVLYQMD